MQIDRSTSQPSGDASRPQRPTPPAQAAAAGAASRTDQASGERRDAIELSPQARKVVQLPQPRDERAALVDRLRQEVDAGTYRPDADAVARRIAEQFDR